MADEEPKAERAQSSEQQPALASRRQARHSPRKGITMQSNAQQSRLQDLYDTIDQQIKAEKAKQPLGDRRRTDPLSAHPPEGQQERRAGFERRGRNRKF